MSDTVSLWQSRLDESRHDLGEGVSASRLASRYPVETTDEIEELTNRATLEMVDGRWSTLTLEEFDKAAERMGLEVSDRELVTDGGVTTSQRVTWPRRYESGNPIVGYNCANCGFGIEHVYQPSLLRKCPSCGGNPQGVRLFEVEQLVEERRERLQEQLASHYGHPMSRNPECSVCGTDEDVHLDPGENLENFEYRCPEHHLLGYSYWWQPGDHPGLLTRDWIETCDDCGAEFTSVFGISFRSERGNYTRDLCLRCTDIDWLRRVLDDWSKLEAGDSP